MRRLVVVLVGVFLAVVVACNENPADVDIFVNDTLPCDSSQCPPPLPPVHDTVTLFDTLTVTVTDSIYIWCRKVGWRHGAPWYRCDNGYEGPMH